MRVGCGIWGSGYGYSSGSDEEEKIWVDSMTGAVLKEEGWFKGKVVYRVEYKGGERG